MNQLALTYQARARTARKLGSDAGERCIVKAAANDPDFRNKALTFIVAYVRQEGEVTGESATLAAVLAGIKPHDQRAFGPVYQEALKRNLLRVVGMAKRVRGHGSAGGKVYAIGSGK